MTGKPGRPPANIHNVQVGGFTVSPHVRAVFRQLTASLGEGKRSGVFALAVLTLDRVLRAGVQAVQAEDDEHAARMQDVRHLCTPQERIPE